MSKARPGRITLRVDDAIAAFTALRSSIEEMDELLSRKGDWTGKAGTVEYRAERWEAYQRIAKALHLDATLSTQGNAWHDGTQTPEGGGTRGAGD